MTCSYRGTKLNSSITQPILPQHFNETDVSQISEKYHILIVAIHSKHAKCVLAWGIQVSSDHSNKKVEVVSPFAEQIKSITWSEFAASHIKSSNTNKLGHHFTDC